MLIYILKSVTCMAIFYAFYKLLLEKENMHVFKRFYLLLAIGASLVIPALVFTEYVVVEPAEAISYVETRENSVSNSEYIGVPATLEKDVLDIEPILWTVYFLGFVFFGLKFIKNLSQIVSRIRKNPKQKSTSFTQVLLKENFPPHTFFKYIFLNKQKLEAKEIPHEVLLHEETHARQKHSLDVIFIELLQVIFWFNPAIYLFKKAIKLNHEFLADQAVLDKDIDKTTYQNTLLSYLSTDSQHKYQSKMANAINYSSIKKRFTVMKTHTSKKSVFLRSLLLLPLLALLLLGFSETRLIEVNPSDPTEMLDKASSQELDNYNTLAKKYNAIPIEQRKIPLADLKVLESLFRKMTADQKKNAQPFPECLPQAESDKKFILNIDNSKIILNNKQVDLVSFAEEVDETTKSWEETDYTSVTAIVNFSTTPKSFLEKVEHEFKKTHFSKANEGSSIFPNDYSGQLNSDGASRKLMAEYNALAKKYNEMLLEKSSIHIKGQEVERMKYIYGLMSEKQKADSEPFPDFPPMPKAPKAPKPAKMVKAPKGEKSNIPSPQEPQPAKPAKAPKIKKGEISDIPQPPTPPEPQTPLDHVIEMAKKGATFYYEGKEVNSDEAIELLKNNKNLNIDSRGGNKKNPVVRISKNPIIIE